MASPGGADPIDAMEQFLGRIAPYDPDPNEAIMSVELRIGRSRGTFELTARAAQALTEVLARYVDPDDHGTCPNCGTRLDASLRCAGCGRVDGIFGQALAHHMVDVLRRDEGSG
jgi:hypothetical protein